jgi:hypothetical protein
MSMAVAKAIRDSHDGQNESAPASVNKVYQVLPKTTFPAAPFNGTSYQVEFELPTYMGKVIDNVLQFDLTFTTADTSGKLTLTPSTLFVDRIESVLGSQTIESQDQDQIHLATLAYLTDQEFTTIQKSVNIASDGDLAAEFSVGSAAVVKKTFYLPLWSNAINSFQPFVRGFKDTWRFRIWLTPNITASYTGATSVQIGCSNLALWSTEAQLSDAATQALEDAHKHGIRYRGCMQKKWESQESAISSAGEYRKVLTSLNQASAGLLCFIKKNSIAPADLLDKSPVEFIGLLDSAGSELTQRLPAELIRSFVNPETVPVTTRISADAVKSFYLFPLSGNLANVLETGEVGGGLKFSGTEQIVLRPSSSVTNVTVVVVSYNYAVMVVSRGNATVEQHA